MPRLITEAETKQKDLQHVENKVKASVTGSRLSWVGSAACIRLIKIIPPANFCRDMKFIGLKNREY